MTTLTQRTRNLGLAAGLAVVAALLTTLYVSRAEGGTKVGTPAAHLASVLVATKDLPIGTSLSGALSSGAIRVTQVPADSVAPDAAVSATGLRGQVVVQPIYAGEQVTGRRFGTTGQQGMRAVLHGALRAITIPGDTRQLLAGVLAAGDHVDLVVNDKVNGQAPKTRVALRNLIVLAPPGGEGTVSTPSSSDGSTQATLQLTDRQVQVLWWVVKNGDWSLVLRPTAKAAVTAKAPTTESDVLEGR
jgi:Flp pilus assembly protein CpaB